MLIVIIIKKTLALYNLLKKLFIPPLSLPCPKQDILVSVLPEKLSSYSPASGNLPSDSTQ